MRIAVSGAHRVGKTTLIDTLSALLPDHVVVDEPYVQLEDEGHDFEAVPSIDDFEAQLRRSLRDLRDIEGPAIFDRSPLDFMAYLACHDDAAAFDAAPWWPRLRQRLRSLDAIVFVGVEQPDRVDVDGEDRRWRACVDASLRELLFDGVARRPVIAVRGTPEQRAQQVLRALQQRPTTR